MLLLIFILAFATYQDIRTNKVSNYLILVGIIVGLGMQFYLNYFWGVLVGIISCVIPMIILYPLFVMGALGAGDLKLFMVIGCFFSLSETVICVFLSFLIAFFLALFKMYKNHIFFQRMEHFLQYMQDVFQSGKFLYYETYDEEENFQHKIHFTIAILMSALLHVGGVY